MKSCIPWRTALCGLVILLAGCEKPAGHSADTGGKGQKPSPQKDVRQETLKALADLARQNSQLLKDFADTGAPFPEDQKKLGELGSRMEELVSRVTQIDRKKEPTRFYREADRIWLEAIREYAPELKPVVEKIQKDKAGQEASTAVNVLKSALQEFSVNAGRYPTNQEGLEALWKQPEGNQRWDGPYLRTPMPNDPWGHAWLYRTDSQRGYILQSVGPDGKADSGDEIIVSPE